MKKYTVVICGGTFDLLHKGHKSFLKQLVELADKIVIGLTSDTYVSKFKNQNNENFQTRKRNVLDFLKTIGAAGRVEILEINDIYGPLLDINFKASAMAVTSQTNRTAVGINEERRELGLTELPIEIIDLDPAEDEGLISSTRIRNGEINREGRLYVNEKWLNNALYLPESLRAGLHRPMGKILSDVPGNLDSKKIVTIGDITTQRFNEKKIGQFLSIVDYQVKREKKFDKLSDLGFEEEIKILKSINPAATITPRLFEVIQEAFESKKRQVILVEGEEDLAVLPVLLVSPLGFMIYYGQPARIAGQSAAGGPNEGLVELKVTEEIKEKTYDLVNKFNS